MTKDHRPIVVMKLIYGYAHCTCEIDSCG